MPFTCAYGSLRTRQQRLFLPGSTICQLYHGDENFFNTAAADPRGKETSERVLNRPPGWYAGRSLKE